MKNNLEQIVFEFISFYGAMGRATSLLEIQTRAPIPAGTQIKEILESINSLTQKEWIIEENGFFAPKGSSSILVMRTKQDFLLDIKWKRLQRMSRIFRYIPFVEFALVSGSMSFGAIRPSSDFDILLGVRTGRIFTTRYIASGLFSLFRARRLDDLEESSPNKFCFNHIITSQAYEKQPHNYYRYELYRHLIPIFIDGPSYEIFREKNNWAHISELNQYVAQIQKPSKCKKYIETLLGGTFGNFIEQYITKPIALHRLKTYINRKQNDGRVIISDEEMEFHFQLNYETMFSKFEIPT